MYEFLIGEKKMSFDLSRLVLIDENGSYNLRKQASASRKRIYFKLTRSCNLNCVYCFQRDETKVFKKISLDDYDTVLDKCLDSKETDFYLFGGEPFLDSQYNNVRYLLDKGTQSFFVFTNGCFSKKYHSLIAQYLDRLTIIISLDGIEDVHNSRRIYPSGNSFKKIIENIEYLRSINAIIILQINIDSENISSINAIFHFLHQLIGVNNIEINLNPVLHYGSASIDFMLLKKYVELDNIYSLTRCFLNNKVVQKLSSILSGKGVDTHRCNLDNTYIIDFESKLVYCCPENSKTIIGQLSGDEIIINQSDFETAYASNNKELPPCCNCEYRSVCGYGCFLDTHDYTKCKTEIEMQVRYFLSNAGHFIKVRA